MRELFDQVEAAAKSRFWYLALFGAMAIPDVCGAMSAPDGQANSTRFIHWFDQFVAPKYVMPSTGFCSMTGTDAWNLRCSLLHQGTTVQPRSRWDRVIFTRGGIHNVAMVNCIIGGQQLYLLTIAIPNYCSDVVSGGRAWLATAETTPEYARNYDRFLQVRPNGLSPSIRGWMIA